MRASVSPELREEIRARYAAGGTSERKLAKEYGTSREFIRGIIDDRHREMHARSSREGARRRKEAFDMMRDVLNEILDTNLHRALPDRLRKKGDMAVAKAMDRRSISNDSAVPDCPCGDNDGWYCSLEGCPYPPPT